MRHVRSVKMFILMALFIAAIGLPAAAHPDPPGAKDTYVNVFLNRARMTPDPSDGLFRGDAEMYMFLTVDQANHGGDTLQLQDDDVVNGDWRPSPGKAVWSHNECSPREEIVLNGFVLELDAGLDVNMVSNIASGLAGMGPGFVYGGLKGAIVGFVVGTLSGILLGLNDNDDYGKFKKVLPGPGKYGIAEFKFSSDSTGKETTRFDGEIHEIERGRVVCLSPITATFEGTATTYTVKVSNSEDFTLRWTKTGDDCGTFTVNRPTLKAASATWSHPHPPCQPKLSHSSTITFTMSAPDYTCTAVYSHGSTPGTGDAPTCKERLPTSISHYLDAGTEVAQATPTPEQLAGKVFNPLGKALTAAPEINREPGNPGELSKADLQNTRDTYVALAMGLAKFATGVLIDNARGFQGAQAAVDAYSAAEQQANAGELTAAMDGLRAAYVHALNAIAGHIEGDPNARLPLHVVAAPNLLGTRVGKKATILGAVVGSDGPIDVELTGAPAGVTATLASPPLTPTIFTVALDLRDAQPGEFVLTISVANGSTTATEEVTVKVARRN